MIDIDLDSVYRFCLVLQSRDLHGSGGVIIKVEKRVFRQKPIQIRVRIMFKSENIQKLLIIESA